MAGLSLSTAKSAPGDDNRKRRRLLKTGLVSYKRRVPLIKVRLTEGQFDALVSFTYNVGARSLRHRLFCENSTPVITLALPMSSCAGIKLVASLNGLTPGGRQSVCSCQIGAWLSVTAAAAGVALIGVLAFFVNHYRDNAITYKDQRDKATKKLRLANATIKDMQVRQRDVAALDAKYTKELSDAKNH
jgi:hypothetical protein